jgi:hypothetical protein
MSTGEAVVAPVDRFGSLLIRSQPVMTQNLLQMAAVVVTLRMETIVVVAGVKAAEAVLRCTAQRQKKLMLR